MPNCIMMLEQFVGFTIASGYQMKLNALLPLQLWRSCGQQDSKRHWGPATPSPHALTGQAVNLSAQRTLLSNRHLPCILPQNSIDWATGLSFQICKKWYEAMFPEHKIQCRTYSFSFFSLSLQNTGYSQQESFHHLVKTLFTFKPGGKKPTPLTPNPLFTLSHRLTLMHA